MASYMAKVYANLIRNGKKKNRRGTRENQSGSRGIIKCLDCCSFYY